MNGLWIFAYVVLPIVVVVMGYVAMRIAEDQARRPHPGE